MYGDYDFLNEGYEVFDQRFRVKSITKGDIDDIQIIEGGSGYKLKDKVNFDLSTSGGTGLSAEVSELSGKDVISVNTVLISMRMLFLNGKMIMR